MTITDEIILFWFGSLDTTAEVDKREVWFKATPEFDASIAHNFTDAYEQAANSKLDYLADDQFGCLTLIILLDQIPRNLFRNSGKAYATDNKALSVARGGLEKGYDRNMSSWHKVFFYLPFEHSEKINDQNFSVQLFKGLEFESAIEAAIDHQKIIKKFGRFPYRNEALGRSSTPEEIDFLKTPPPWGKTKAELDELESKKAG